jgi:hypothetical protein
MAERQDRRERTERLERKAEKAEKENNGGKTGVIPEAVNQRLAILEKSTENLLKAMEAKQTLDAQAVFKAEINEGVVKSVKTVMDPVVARLAALEGKTAPAAGATVGGFDVKAMGEALREVETVANTMGLKREGSTTTEAANLEGIPVSGSVPAWIAAIPLTMKAILNQVSEVATKFGIFGKPPEGSKFQMPSLTGDTLAKATLAKRAPSAPPRPPPPPPPIDNSPLLRIPAKKVVPPSPLFKPSSSPVPLSTLLSGVKASEVLPLPPPPPLDDDELKPPKPDSSLTILKPAIEETETEPSAEIKLPVTILENPVEVVEKAKPSEAKVDENKPSEEPKPENESSEPEKSSEKEEPVSAK